mmetsp:Transcript_34752/g.52434  ORF Transcript_34752/g.52434 Transcript_34752/m.52434 type:complete len:301 (+) Transcript_34752:308-1210(+)
MKEFKNKSITDNKAAVAIVVVSVGCLEIPTTTTLQEAGALQSPSDDIKSLVLDVFSVITGNYFSVFLINKHPHWRSNNVSSSINDVSKVSVKLFSGVVVCSISTFQSNGLFTKVGGALKPVKDIIPKERLGPDIFGWYAGCNVLINHLLGVHFLSKSIKWHVNLRSLQLRSELASTIADQSNGLGVSRNLGTFTSVKISTPVSSSTDVFFGSFGISNAGIHLGTKGLQLLQGKVRGTALWSNTWGPGSGTLGVHLWTCNDVSSSMKITLCMATNKFLVLCEGDIALHNSSTLDNCGKIRL